MAWVKCGVGERGVNGVIAFIKNLESNGLKSIERLAYWEIIEDSGDALISKNQHAFRKNYSTETALSVLVDNIEDCITRSNYALICNLDIQGAFDNALYSTILDSMVKNNIKPKLVKWFLKLQLADGLLVSSC